MALNTNHIVEDLNDVKCAIVEKNISKERSEFLKNLLEINNYTVHVIPAAPPKAPKTAVATPETTADSSVPNTSIDTEIAKFTIGVTDVRFNSVNAVFGRLLKTFDGHIVTLAYWNQTDTLSHDEIPYYETAGN